MPETAPRYEFRTFAENLVPLFQELQEKGNEPLKRENEELYIVSESCWDTNFKIRDGKLDIKVLVQQREGLEQWMPKVKQAFPLEAEFVKENILDDIYFDSEHPLPELSGSSYSQEQLLELLNGRHGVKVVEVKKKRHGFLVGECITEFAELMIDGKMVHTVAVESTEVQAVLGLLRELDIDRRENVNYPLAIRRMVGLEPEEAGEHC
jgi:hypothetical protein